MKKFNKDYPLIEEHISDYEALKADIFSISLAAPKSESFILSSPSNSMFAPLRSA